MRTILTLALICILAVSTVCRAQNTPQKQSNSAARPYLGIAVEPLHHSLVHQMLELLGDGRGVLVAEIAAGSPAENAGVKPDDVLVGYDDQKLYSPEQLVKLVQNDKPGREVTLDVIHAGKKEELKVILGERKTTAVGEYQRRTAARLPWQSLEQGQRPTTEEQAARWGTFDAMTLSRVDEDHFKAEIKFRDDQGKVETHVFQGTREQLRRDIDAEKHLPTNERNHLLRALDLARHPAEFEFPGIRFAPDNGVLWDFEDAGRYPR